MSNLNVVLVSKDDISAADTYADYTIFQTDPWLAFLQETQRATPVYAAIVLRGRIVGRFTGLTVEKFGIRMLGSPLRGWTTGYMGLNLTEGVDRLSALRLVNDWAFRELGCLHLEIMDRQIEPLDLSPGSNQFSLQTTFEIDLTKSEEALFKAMTSACRRCIRKAEANGVQIEVATDAAFAEEYYEQLRDVFSKQRIIPPYKRNRIESLMRHLLPSDHLLLLRARDLNATCIATGVFPAANDTMHFWGGASWRQHQHLRPNEALQWAAIRYWKARGMKRYDMGGGGEYKEKYGGRRLAIPWLRASKYSGIEVLRCSAFKAWHIQQKIMAFGMRGMSPFRTRPG